jgi:SAM-dependent methyltransferase
MIRCCLACGRCEDRLLYRVSRFGVPLSFRKCVCGLISQDPLPTVESIDRFFNSDIFLSSVHTGQTEVWGYYDYFGEDRCRLLTAQRRYAFLKDFVAPNDVVLQIGPGTDPLLKLFQDKGNIVIGCDASQKLAQIAATSHSVPMKEGRFEEQNFASGYFGCILLLNVIENVPNLGLFLSEISRTLRAGGYLILNFVDMHSNLLQKLQGQRYFLFRPPVCYMFPYTILSMLLAKNGFSTIRFARDVRYIDLEKVSTLLRLKWLLSMTRWTGLHKKPFPTYAYPSKLVVARKQNAGEEV